MTAATPTKTIRNRAIAPIIGAQIALPLEQSSSTLAQSDEPPLEHLPAHFHKGDRVRVLHGSKKGLQFVVSRVCQTAITLEGCRITYRAAALELLPPLEQPETKPAKARAIATPRVKVTVPPEPITHLAPGDRIASPSGIATITDIEQVGRAQVVHADYGSGIPQPHQVEGVTQQSEQQECDISDCLKASAALPSQQNDLVLSQPSSLKSIPGAKKSSRKISTASRAMQTFETSTAQSILISSAADSPAKTSAWQIQGALAWLENEADCFGKQLGLLSNADPVSSSSKMSTLQRDESGQPQQPASLNVWDTPSIALTQFPAVPLEQLISEKDFSLFPTPQTSDCFRVMFKLETLKKDRRGKKGRGSLVEVAAAEFSAYPTPMLYEWLMGFPEDWTLPIAKDFTPSETQSLLSLQSKPSELPSSLLVRGDTPRTSDEVWLEGEMLTNLEGDRIGLITHASPKQITIRWQNHLSSVASPKEICDWGYRRHTPPPNVLGVDELAVIEEDAIATLEHQIRLIKSAGAIAPDGCWLERAKCNKRKCYQVYYRSSQPIFQGKKRQYVGMSGTGEVAAAGCAIARRNELKVLRRQLEVLRRDEQ
jgi:ribosomal protein L24